MARGTKQRGEAANYYNTPNGSHQQYNQPSSYTGPPQGGVPYELHQQQQQQYQQQQQQPQQQYYNQGPPPPPDYGYIPPSHNPQGGDKLTFNQTFEVEKPKWNDLWAGILFIAVCCGFVAVSVVAFRGYDFSKNNSTNIAINTKTGDLFLLVILVAWVLSYAYVWLARLFPKAFIWTSGILNLVFGLATAALLLVK
jgi:hypothetical protein